MSTEGSILIIAGGGLGTRLKEHCGGEKKQFVEVNGKPILEYVLDKFFDYIPIKECILVLPGENSGNMYNYFLDRFPTIKIIEGGRERQDSVYNAIKNIKSKNGKVIVHDAARPFLAKEDLLKVIDRASITNGAVLGVKAKDTVRIGTDIGEEVVARDKVWLIQTPQVFDLDILKRAYENAYSTNFYGTDDAMLVEKMGYKVKLVEGSCSNIKITEPFDLDIARYLLKNTKH